MRALCHAWIYVADIDQAITWYSEVLGLEVSMRDYYPDCVELSQGGGLTLGLQQTGIETPWYKGSGPGSGRRPAEVEFWAQSTITLGFEVDDLDQAMGEMAAKGVDLVYPQAHDFYGGRWAAIRDPFGNCLELIELSAD